MEHPEKEEEILQQEQTVSEMALEVLERQAKALAERSGRRLEEALVEVLKTEPGGQLSELAEGPHRNEKARQWQAALLEERVEQRRLPQGVPG
jgi:ribosomal protein S12 methylthiotransferase accessory factor YcaO